MTLINLTFYYAHYEILISYFIIITYHRFIKTDDLVVKGMKNLMHLDVLFTDGTIKEKREIVGSIYPENLTFDGFAYRTTRINEAINQIYLIDNNLGQNKNGTSRENFPLCRKADRTGLERKS